MLISLDTLHKENIEIGELLTVVIVKAAHILNDLKENIKNLIGGKMNHYELLIQTTLNEALTEIDKQAKEKGYDGVIGLKISNPSVVDGGVEIIVYGNGFKNLDTKQ
jgi:uncharacterized protein YbjQ (UPF0145 family)